tara:strand:+ start:246 stop:404 length:159 start_codon:yes stop_codon:yes gene_type:complete
MDDNRIKAVTPSPTKLKYDPKRKDSHERKNKKPHKTLDKPIDDSENAIDDYA